jgi:hypothetical protein
MAQRRLLAASAVAALLGAFMVIVPVQAVAEPGCQQVLVVFARGSGQNFKNSPTTNRDAVSFFNAIKKNFPAAAVANVDIGNLDGNGEISEGEYAATGHEGLVGYRP